MELHDELGQYVTAIKSIAQSMANRKDELDVKITTIVKLSFQFLDKFMTRFTISSRA